MISLYEQCNLNPRVNRTVDELLKYSFHKTELFEVPSFAKHCPEYAAFICIKTRHWITKELGGIKEIIIKIHDCVRLDNDVNPTRHYLIYEIIEPKVEIKSLRFMSRKVDYYTDDILEDVVVKYFKTEVTPTLRIKIVKMLDEGVKLIGNTFKIGINKIEETNKNINTIEVY